MSEHPGGADKLYVWFDTEYSSLEIETASLLQVSALITDSSLRRVLPQEQDVRLAILLPDGVVLSPWVEQNLSGLVKACRSPGSVSVAEADARLASYVDAAAGLPAKREIEDSCLPSEASCSSNQRPVLAGNSVHTDWWLARRFLPLFSSRLHYRHLDVTALKLEWQRLRFDAESEASCSSFEKEDPDNIRRYFPEAALSVSDSRHDAYYDVQASIAELAFYRRFLLREGL
jgi:oligoribonuclease (3'-5' exoribonuclease)